MKQMRLRAYLVATVLTLPLPASAWNIPVHMLSVAIGVDQGGPRKPNPYSIGI